MVSATEQVDPSAAYLEQAASGSAEAFAALRDYSLQAGDVNHVSAAEAIAAARMYGHMAASFGGSDAWRKLVHVLKLSTDNYLERGLTQQAERDAYEVVAVLHCLAEVGDDLASAAIVEMGFDFPETAPESDEHMVERMRQRKLLALAARRMPRRSQP